MDILSCILLLYVISMCVCLYSVLRDLKFGILPKWRSRLMKSVKQENILENKVKIKQNLFFCFISPWQGGVMVEVQYHLPPLSGVYSGCISPFPLSTLCLALPKLINSLHVNLSQTWVAAINEGGILCSDSAVRAHRRVIYSLRHCLEEYAGVV